MVALLLAGLAAAGSGPWVVGTGSRDAYFGVESQHLSQLAIETESGSEVIDVGEGLNTLGAKAIFTYGVRPRVDISAVVPWYRVMASRPEHELCVALGLSACRTTQGIGILAIRGKGLLLDELYGSPVSLSLGAEVRYGSFTAGNRERITNIGEGTFDLGPMLAIGRSMGVGSGYASAMLEGGYRFRQANTDSYPSASGGVPGGEIFADSSLLIAPTSWFVVGPVLSGLWRPSGLDWFEVDLADIDRFAALRIYNVRAGGMVILRNADPTASSNLAFSFSALKTIAAMNNPTDVLIVSIGLSINQPAGN